MTEAVCQTLIPLSVRRRQFQAPAVGKQLHILINQHHDNKEQKDASWQ